MSKPRLTPPSLQLPFPLGPCGNNSVPQRGDCHGSVGAAGVGVTWHQVQVWKPSHRNTWAWPGGALRQGRWETGESPEIKHLPPQFIPGAPSEVALKPQKMSQQWELQGEGLKMPMSQKVSQSGSPQETAGTFRPG